jgi:hypothetical protein
MNENDYRDSEGAFVDVSCFKRDQLAIISTKHGNYERGTVIEGVEYFVYLTPHEIKSKSIPVTSRGGP